MSSSAFERPRIRGKVGRLCVVFGDQLDLQAEALRSLDREADGVLMMEVAGESEEGPSHRQRTALFLSAMRHFALELVEAGYRVDYVTLDDRSNTQAFESEIVRAGKRLKAADLVATRPGEWRVCDALEAAAEELGIACEILGDDHFLTTIDQFESWASGRKQLVMEYFYREQRKRLDVLMDGDGKPVGGKWNFDEDNRDTFKSAPDVRAPYTPRVDEITREVCALVERRLPDLPGSLDPDSLRWPVTRDQARRALDDFIEHRLPLFGRFEDAMWDGEPFLYHSLLSPALNLKLLDPRLCVAKAVAAYEAGDAPLNSVEGFVRQIIGWREFIRGIYWTQPADYRDRNELDHHGALPDFYWTGETDMRCMADCLAPVLEHAFSHHIPRLMVLSNFALTSGIAPRALGDWFYGMYADSVDWVTTPNTIGMALHADGAVVGTKPYSASGKYIQRMGNYCGDCRYDVKKRHGDTACPFNVFYWDFLIRHRERFRRNNRMAMILKNVDRMAEDERARIASTAADLRTGFGIDAERTAET